MLLEDQSLQAFLRHPLDASLRQETWISGRKAISISNNCQIHHRNPAVPSLPEVRQLPSQVIHLRLQQVLMATKLLVASSPQLMSRPQTPILKQLPVTRTLPYPKS